MSTAKLSSKNQVVVPREAREALKVRSGDELLFVVRGDHVIVMKRPKSYAAALRGLAKGMYPPDYLERSGKVGSERQRRFPAPARANRSDTSAIIYQLEANSKYVDLTHPVFLWIEQPNHLAFSSAITMAEVLVRGYRSNNRQEIDRFFGCLTTYPNLQWIPADLQIADAAAQIRAKFNLRTPDALQAATALRSGATGLVTNDPMFMRVEGIETAVLDRYL